MFSAQFHEHARLRDLAAQIRSFLSETRLSDIAVLQQLRVELHALLAQHLRAESQLVSTVLSTDFRASVVSLSAQVETRSNSWLDNYNRHCARWPIDSVASDWPTFREEGVRLLDLMLAQIDWEEQDLYPAIVAIAETAASFQKALH